jgi:hypothetical protein
MTQCPFKPDLLLGVEDRAAITEFVQFCNVWLHRDTRALCRYVAVTRPLFPEKRKLKVFITLSSVPFINPYS